MIVLGDDMRDRILSKGIAPERVVVVRDGTSFPDVDAGHGMTPSCARVCELRCGFPFVAVHAGNLGFYGAWGTLLKAAEILAQRKDTGFVFIGDGANRKALEASAANSAQCSVSSVSPVRAGAARDDGGRYAHRDREARARRRRCAQQALLDFRGGTAGAGGRREGKRRCAHCCRMTAAAWRPIRMILPPWPRRSGNCAAIRRGWARWADALGKPQKNMLE